MTGAGLLISLRLRGLLNTMRQRPAQYAAGGLLLALVSWGVFSVTRRGVRFLDRYLSLGNADIADAILQRSLESLVLVLALGVAFSVLSTAIHTLYSSHDLPFLLALPAPSAQVFGLKVAEVYASAALLPAVFTLPVLGGLGLERGAPWSYYPVATLAVLALYALPVALGSLLALLLMRLSPAGRVKEVATALSVVLAAGLILGLRVLRPERLADLSLEEVTALLGRLASFELGYLPSSWTSQAVWGALSGQLGPGLLALLALSLLSLWLVAGLSALAYQQGWLRAQGTGSPRLDPSVRPSALWERALHALGRSGALIVKDVRLLLRDPTQWSQLLVLLALAGVYLASVGSLSVDVTGPGSQRFRDAIGGMNLLFLGFLLSGVGVRMAYPLVSLEGEGFWLLQSGPLSSRQIVLAKFWHSLPVMLGLGLGLGLAASMLIDSSPTLAWASPIAGVSAALAVTGLGVGLGAAFPKFDATSPSDIPMTAGGLLYMALSLVYSAALMLLLAYPAWRALLRPGELLWTTPTGILILALIALLTLLATALPLAYGSYRLARYEAGD